MSGICLVFLVLNILASAHILSQVLATSKYDEYFTTKRAHKWTLWIYACDGVKTLKLSGINCGHVALRSAR